MARKLLEVAAEVPGLGVSRGVAVGASRQRGSARPLYSNHAEYIDLLSSFLDTPTVISVPLIVVPQEPQASTALYGHLVAYYQDNTLHSELARKIFVFPDQGYRCVSKV